MFKKRTEIFDCNFVYFIILSMFVVLRIVSSTFSIGEVAGYILNFVFQVGLACSLPIFLYSYLRKQNIKTTLNYYGFKKINFKSVLISLALGVLVYILTIFISSFFSGIISMFGFESLGGSSLPEEFPVWLLIIELFATAVLPGICEEVANRGMLLNCYKSFGAKKAIFLSGLLFGLMHLNIEQFFYATIIGFYFGFVALTTDSIYPTMIMHFTNNAISGFMSFAIVNELPASNILNSVFGSLMSGNIISGFLVLIIFLSCVVAAVVYLTKQLCKETKVKRLTQVADRMVRTELRNELLSGIADAKLEEPTQSSEIELKEHIIGGKRFFNVNIKQDILIYTPTYYPTFKDNMFMYINLFLSILITVFTFIWGIL